MARRLLYTFLIAALGAAAFWLGRPEPPQDLGLVVHVYVEDAQGEPLPNAQAERLFDPGWQVVNPDGYRRFTHVRLRADQGEPSAEAIGQAVRVRAPFYTLPHGRHPDIHARTDGTWEARYTLHHHGVLRVHLEGTHLGHAKAFLEPDEEGRWEAMDLGNVARPGAPAAFRIYPGTAHVVIRVVGEADQHGAVAVATRRYFVEPPGAGHVVEKHLVPDEVKPIIGVVVPPDGPPAPTLRGVARVTELAPGGRRIPHDAVPIGDEGMFVVRAVGAGRYEIQPELDFLRRPPAVTVEGGGSVDITGARPRPWAVLEHEGFDARTAGVTFFRNDKAVRSVLRGKNASTIPLPAAGSWPIHAIAEGTDASPPLRLWARVRAAGSGEHTAAMKRAVIPHGTLVVKTPKEAWTKAKGATVTVGARKRTLLRGLAEEAVFKHLRTGRRHVRLEWNDEAARPVEAEVEVAAQGTAEVTLSYEAK